MSDETNVTSTVISKQSISTPTINANELNIYKMGSLNADIGYIKELTVDVFNINDGETSSATENSETTENAQFNAVNLNFADDYNCVYMLADDNTLSSNPDGYELNIDFTVPAMGSKLVCRYLVLDLRKIETTKNITIVWPIFTVNGGNSTITWLYGVPDIQAGYFYVLSFQRFTEDLIIGNVAVKIERLDA